MKRLNTAEDVRDNVRRLRKAPSLAQYEVPMVFTDRFARELFSDLFTMRDLPPSLSELFVALGSSLEEIDALEAGVEVDKGSPLPARYYHPDSLRGHYESHTVAMDDCPCHPNNRADCEVCSTHLLLVSFEGS